MPPFPEQAPRPFTREEIERIEPGPPGVYALLTEAGEYIAIGAGELRDELLARLESDDVCIAAHAPTQWVYWRMPADHDTAIAVLPNIERRRVQLTLELHPLCRDHGR